MKAGLDAAQLRHEIVRPALIAIGLHSPAAENLVMGTAAHESLLRYVRQKPGPALGIFQMEPATYHDIWDNWLKYREALERDIRRAIGFAAVRPSEDRMVWDFRLATIMCRLHYRRVSEPLPEADDVEGMADYWKHHYNTEQGKGTRAQFIKHYELVREKDK